MARKALIAIGTALIASVYIGLFDLMGAVLVGGP